TMIAILNTGGGLPAIFGAVMAASLIGLIVTPTFSRIIRFFPPLVTGIVITTIGLTLMPVAALWAMGGNSAAPDSGSMGHIGLAAGTLPTVLVLTLLGKATLYRRSILIAILIGTLAAAATGQPHFPRVTQGDYFGLPSLFPLGWPPFQV